MILGHGRNQTSPQTFPQGCSLLRLHDSGVNWAQLNPSKGIFNWTPLDARLAEAEAHGLKVLYVFSNTPAWAGTPVPGAPPGLPSPTGNLPPNFEDWVSFVAALTAHAGNKIAAWELWNECNYDGFWAEGYPDLLAMCEIAWAMIKGANPDAVVLTPSVTYSWSGNNVLTALPQLLDLGFQSYADGLAIHGYLAAGAPATGIGATLDGVHVMMAKHNLSMGIWDTEWGYGTQSLTDAAKAQYVKDGLATRLYAGLAAASWYNWDDPTHGTMCDLKTGGLTAAGQAWLDVSNSWHA